jgi:hypothetical protein
METADWQPDSEWSADEWAFEARAARDALAALGVTVPACLAGEPADCGTPAWAHYATYLAMVKARAQAMLEANLSHPQPGVSAHYGRDVYEEVLGDYRRQFAELPPLSEG